MALGDSGAVSSWGDLVPGYSGKSVVDDSLGQTEERLPWCWTRSPRPITEGFLVVREKYGWHTQRQQSRPAASQQWLALELHMKAGYSAGPLAWIPIPLTATDF